MPDKGSPQAEGVLLRVGKRLWRFFSSVRLAFFLMLVIVSLSLIGALLIQVPADVAADPAIYAAWLEIVAQPKLGLWTPLLSLFGLFNIFHSPWFLGAGALLVVNIVVCSLNRWRRLSSAVAGGPIKQKEAFFLSGTNRVEIASASLISSATIDVLHRVLRAHHYRVRSERAQTETYLTADKNRYSAFGTYLSHLSLVLFVIGFLMGSYLGFRDVSFAVPEGAIRQVGHGTDLSLRLDSFIDDYWPDGTPKDFLSQVVVYENGEEVKRETIRVNHPLSYKGTRFHQSFFGPAAVMQVKTTAGDVLFNDCVALSAPFSSPMFQGYVGNFNLPQAGLMVYLIEPADSANPMIQEDELILDIYEITSQERVALTKVTPGEPEQLGKLEFAFVRRAKYSGFQVSQDPGSMLIWIASALFLIGLGMVLYFPHRQIWALVQSGKDGGSRILMRSNSARNIGAAPELEKVAGDIKAQLALDGKTHKDKEV